MPTSNTQGLLHLFRSGGGPLMVFGLLGRLPTAMAPMLLLVAIPLGGGTLVQAGTAVGLSALGTAGSGAVVGLLVDRFGARPVVSIIAVMQAMALVGLATQFNDIDASPLLLPLAFVVGLSNPAVGSLARAAWVRRVDSGNLDGPASRSAMAWEASSDEVGFVIAPVVASLVLAVVEPRAALVGLALAGLVLHLGFVRLVPLRVPSVKVSRRQVRGSILNSVFGAHAGLRHVLVTASALLIVTAVGFVFGATQASVNSLFTDLGIPTMVGVVYGLVGVGSIIGGITWAQIPDRRRGMWIVLAAGTALVASGAFASGWIAMGVVPTAVLCAFVGLWLSPVLAEAYNRARSDISGSFQVTLMTILASGTSVGVGFGAMLASRLAVAETPQTGFLGLTFAGLAFLAGGGYVAFHGVRCARNRESSLELEG